MLQRTLSPKFHLPVQSVKPSRKYGNSCFPQAKFTFVIQNWKTYFPWRNSHMSKVLLDAAIHNYAQTLYTGVL